MSDNGIPIATTKVKAVPLSESEYGDLVNYVYGKTTSLPSALIQKLGMSALKHYKQDRKSTTELPLKKREFEFNPSMMTLSPTELMDYQIGMTLQAYLFFRQPCLIIIGRGGYTVLTNGVTYNTIVNAVNDPEIDAVLYTDGNNYTKLK